MDQMHDRLRSTAGRMSFRQIGSMTETHPETVRRYMQGQAPSVAFVVRFADAFGVRIEWLLAGRGPMRAEDTAEPAAAPVGMIHPVSDPVTLDSRAGQAPAHPLASTAMESKQTADAVAASACPVPRSARPLEDIRRRLAERRRCSEGPEGGHYDAA